MLEKPEMKLATGLLVSITNRDMDKFVARKTWAGQYRALGRKIPELFGTDPPEGRGAAE
jgi:hypothetical protein